MTADRQTRGLAQQEQGEVDNAIDAGSPRRYERGAASPRRKGKAVAPERVTWGARAPTQVPTAASL
jgi:hypothetical protein